MATSMIPLSSNNVPSVFAGRRPSMVGNAQAGVAPSFGVATYRSSRWGVKFRGEEHQLRHPSGSRLTEFDVVIVGVAAGVSKTFYDRQYTEGDDNPPDCFSLDGEKPDASAPDKQSSLCSNCPKNQWGSATTSAGRNKGKACKDTRRLAVVPLDDIENKKWGGPLLLRVPPTSLGNLASYGSFLERAGADFPFVGTQISFEDGFSYPRLQFSTLGFLPDHLAEQVIEVMKSPTIGRILNESETVAAPAAAPVGELPGKPAAAFQQRPEAPRLVSSQPPKKDEEEDEEEPVQVQAPAAAPRGRGRPRRQVAAAPPPSADDIDDEIRSLMDGDPDNDDDDAA